MNARTTDQSLRQPLRGGEARAVATDPGHAPLCVTTRATVLAASEEAGA